MGKIVRYIKIEGAFVEGKGFNKKTIFSHWPNR